MAFDYKKEYTTVRKGEQADVCKSYRKLRTPKGLGKDGSAVKLTEELFTKYTVIEERLLPYGFHNEGDSFFYSRLIHNGEFDLQVLVKNQKIDTWLIELEFDEEYTAINRESSGSFVAELKKECEDVLLDIRDKCFKEEYFVFAQTNRIADLIKEKYGVEPERNKDGFGTNGVFRNPGTRKWIGLVMYKKKLNVTGDSPEKVEYLNLNFKMDADLYHGNGIYHPYKKQNRHWIVVIMDDSLTDQEIMDLVDISYEKSNQQMK